MGFEVLDRGAVSCICRMAGASVLQLPPIVWDVGAGSRDVLLAEQILDRIWLYSERCVYEQISCIYSVQMAGIMILIDFRSGEDTSATYSNIIATSP